MKRLLSLPLLLLGCSKAPDQATLDEIKRRDEFTKNILRDGGGIAATWVGSNANVQFMEGFSLVEFDPADDWRKGARRWMGQKGHVRLRTEGGSPMYLKITGWVNEGVIKVKPTMSVYIDGQPVLPREPTGKVDDPGHFFYWETDVPPETFHGREWVNLDIVWNAVAFHWADPPELKVIILSELTWEKKK